VWAHAQYFSISISNPDSIELEGFLLPSGVWGIEKSFSSVFNFKTLLPFDDSKELLRIHEGDGSG